MCRYRVTPGTRTALTARSTMQAGSRGSNPSRAGDYGLFAVEGVGVVGVSPPG